MQVRPDHLFQPIAANRQEALAAGFVFFIGKECKHCNGAKRYASNGNCVGCSKKRNRVREHPNETPSFMVMNDRLKPEPNIMDNYYEF